MKVLFLTNNSLSLSLYEWLKDREEVILYKDKLSISVIHTLKPNFLISYNYRFIISKEILDHIKDNAINLHISYLPWNRGAHPNVWSFLENTPKGVTIHLIDEGIDTGDILVQKEVFINEEKHTLRSSYMLLHKEIQELFKKNWKKIRNKEIAPKPQKGRGSFHYIKDFERIKPIIQENGWDIPIVKFKQIYRSRCLGD